MREPYGWERPIKSQSAPARCYRDLDGKVCGAELQLVVTRSPVPEYEELVVQRCPNTHVSRVQGVLQFVPESWAEDEDGAYGV